MSAPAALGSWTLDDQLAASRRGLDALTGELDRLRRWGTQLRQRLEQSGRLLVAGNGGSATLAHHLAGELVGRFDRERPPFSALALSAEPAAVTAIGNDYGFDEVFARQVRALAVRGDVVLGLSTSGNSENVLRGFAAAAEAGAFRIALGGRDGGRMARECDLALIVPAADTARIQEAHITILHAMCDTIETGLADDGAR